MHPISKIKSYKTIDDFVLNIKFDDNSEQVINFYPVLSGELYGHLRDLNIFNQVRIDPEVNTLVWPNGADFDPETLHDWPFYEEAWIERAKQWDLRAA